MAAVFLVLVGFVVAEARLEVVALFFAGDMVVVALRLVFVSDEADAISVSDAGALLRPSRCIVFSPCLGFSSVFR